MPTNLPSSFASAAAGQNASRDGRAGSRDGRGPGGEWTRREGKSSNGTLTFRRSSSAQVTTPGISESNMLPSSEFPVAPQSVLSEGARYAKEDVLGLFRNLDDGREHPDVAHLFMEGWNPGSGQVNGHSAHGWGKSNDAQLPKDLDSCWNTGGDTRPMGLLDMTGEEREMFQTDVNSPMKQHTQNKDGGQGTGPNGRKASMSHGVGTPYNLSSPTSARPGARRRESIDPSPFSANLASPTSARYTRDDPSYWFGRKGQDKEGEPGDEDANGPGQPREAQPKTPFGLPRANTAGSATGIGSLWSASATTPGGAAGGGSSIGSFGNFALPGPGPSTSNKQFGGRGESRLARLIPQESNENIGGKGPEPGNPDMARSWRSRPRTDTDPFGDDNVGGSALLGGIRDSSPPPLPRQPGQGAFDTPVKATPADLGMSGLHIGPGDQENVPLSPSGTNPYGSPPAERGDDGGHEDDDFDKPRGAVDPSLAFNTASRGYGGNAFDGSDRSQTSSAGPRGYPSLNTYAGWPSGGVGSAGTPDRERAGFAGAFGNTIFSPMVDPQSTGLGFGGGMFGAQPPVGVPSAIGRGSKLGSLFPAQMQAQMQSQDHESLSDSVPDLQQGNPLGAIGRGNIGHGHGRDSATPLRTGQGVLEEVFGSSEAARSRTVGFGTADAQPGISSTAQGQAFPGTGPGAPFSSSQSSADPPTAQVRTMVMPDRMRWVYLDPQGQTQGPFTGLEMNDWYKANFFTPDLRVKKVEDKDFEPLGQLIRRIGNSREPFLVPQIGIPHGPPTQSGPFSPAGAGTGVLPPLSSVFPSFGRTLTAEEQNNLERRKQEEQLVMAQQREAYMRIQQQQSGFRMPGGGVLQHHSSAHSLQSQPSFGSISSPIGMPPQAAPIGTAPAPAAPPAAVASSYFDSPMGQAAAPGAIGPNADMFREDDLANLSTSERQVLASLHASSTMSGSVSAQPVDPAQADPSHGVRMHLPSTEQLDEDPQGFRERLMEFEELRAQRDAEDAAASVTSAGLTEEHEGAPISIASFRSRQLSRDSGRMEAQERDSRPVSSGGPGHKTSGAAAAAAAAKPSMSGLPMPFPPPERYEDGFPEERSPSPPAQPPPMAPWAKETEAHHKGPSLKEIQEAEARKAARAEQAAQAARRAALEQEAAELREKEKAAVAAAPGLPTSSTWGQHSPVNTTSPWAKPATPKAAGPVPAAQTQAEKRRKTLAEIQREEEARKQKAKENVTSVAGPTPGGGGGGGKRYADLASKPNAPPLQHANTPVAAGGGWATVGAGGKVKIPTGPAAQARSVSTGSVKLAAPKPAAPKPAAGPAASKPEGSSAAMEEFKKWLHRELGRGINVNNIDDFASTLMLLPLEVDMISDAVYANSTTMNGKHFAEEFIRRKRLADKGVVEKQPAGTATDGKASSSSGGWNEVAKKGGYATKDQGSGDAMAGAGFKVVPGRKKGKK